MLLRFSTSWVAVLTGSGAYAKQNGKPVVCIWGIGVSGRPGDAVSWTDVVNWLKGQGCYVIIGVPRDWRDNSNSAYPAADMISPWSVGAFSGTAGADNYANTGASPLIANRTAVGTFETFTEVDAGGGKIALLANANGKYVCADNAGANPLIANRTSYGAWETFTVEPK